MDGAAVNAGEIGLVGSGCRLPAQENRTMDSSTARAAICVRSDNWLTSLLPIEGHKAPGESDLPERPEFVRPRQDSPVELSIAQGHERWIAFPVQPKGSNRQTWR